MPVLSFIFLIVVLILAFALDAGNAFMQRRNLQRAADMAALAGAQTLPGCANATSFATVASANATANINAPTLTVSSSCGVWTSPAASATGPGTFVPFTPGNAASAASGNAVSVTLTLSVPSFFQLVGTRTISATAIARKAPAVVTFTVDSGVLALNTNNSVLSSILTPLGVDVQSYVLNGQKLVGTTITPAGLLQALGIAVTGDVTVGALNGLATIQNLTVSQLLSATQTALATQNGPLSASVTALNAVVVALNKQGALNLPVKLFSTATSPGVLANIDMAGVSAANALTANVNVMDLISTAIIGGNGVNAISIPSLSILGNLVTANATIVSPPQIGIGGVGAQANTAQVRLSLQVNTQASGLLGGVLNIAGTSLKLPLTVEIAQSTATVTALQCAPTPSATLQATSGLVNLCVGQDGAGNTSSASSASCTTILTNRTPIATLLGAITVNGQVNASLVTTPTPAPTNTFNGPFPQAWGPVGSSVNLSQVVGALLGGLTVDVGTQPISNSPGASLGSITGGLLGVVPNPGLGISTVNSYLNTAATGLQTTLNGLNSTVGGLLTLNVGSITGGLTTTINGLLGTVGGILNGVLSGLTSALADAVCSANSNPGQCRQKYLNDTNIISTGNLNSILMGVLNTLLNPLLTPISNLINTALSALGVTIGTTTVVVDSVNCQNGLVQLVQ
ncbi:pilus assembly protein TadG-related protein [Pandoraea apista]|uniref:pilus assembly protein TadG-related protein n=1 Tax=Pandoraea apista TaxID=93218 RepID=UPI00058AB8D7|nr:pilus assembly protein TadG-related protein [Pandoraea apista]AJF00234.1 hypothetical protein SG18_22360 [Pandoraea apista]AKH74396.1 hypothetical protein XM39_22540 [Pandoraea apista]AKI62947.1 hypothetical protein AA956_15865 [Pandoraea apista]